MAHKIIYTAGKKGKNESKIWVKNAQKCGTNLLGVTESTYHKERKKIHLKPGVHGQ